jgi:hypothetical protein
MSFSHRHVEAALDRWEDQGLLDAGTAARLREEAREAESRHTRQRARWLIAGVGAFALFLAAVVFTQRTWPLLGVAARTAVLLLAGAAVYVLGATLEARQRWYPSALLLQAGGLAVLLVAEIYSEGRWDHGTLGGVVFGLLALATPLVDLVRFHGRPPATHAVHTAFAFPFAAVFLTRAGDLDFDTTVWILDGLVVLALLGLAARVRSLEADEADGALAAMSAALLTGFVLAVLTGLGPLEMAERAVLPADAWLALATAVTLWGLHRGPRALRRQWFETQLSVCLLVAIPFLAFTTMEAFDWPVEATALAQAALGAAALRYGLRHDARGPLLAGAAALATGAWIYGIERGQAMGAVVALVATAGLLFWVSTRIRDAGARPVDAGAGARAEAPLREDGPGA